MSAKISGKTMIGLLLVLSGVFFFLNPGEWFSPGTFISRLWPTLFVLPLGELFHWGYFLSQRQLYGLLVPGGLLVTVAAVCQIAALFDAWHIMWPAFLLAPAVGLFEMYLFAVFATRRCSSPSPFWGACPCPFSSRFPSGIS